MTRAGFAVSFAALSAACSSDRPSAVTGPPQASGSKQSVRITNFAFAPQELKVTKGTIVEWTNDDVAIHTVSADDDSFDSNSFKQRETFRLTASRVGTFTYFCRIHPYMKGKLTVTP